MKLKFIYFFILSFFSVFATPDSSGWVSLPKPHPYVEEESGVEDGIWVVFSKNLGEENFTIRFPEDPKYLSFQDGIEVSSFKDKEMFDLIIQKRDKPFDFEGRIEEIQYMSQSASMASGLLKAEKISSTTFDFLYSIDEKWVQERILVTPHHVYMMRLICVDSLSEDASSFFDSLYVERSF